MFRIVPRKLVYRKKAFIHLTQIVCLRLIHYLLHGTTFEILIKMLMCMYMYNLHADVSGRDKCLDNFRCTSLYSVFKK